jgi:hydroxypyruvate isomerase
MQASPTERTGALWRGAPRDQSMARLARDRGCSDLSRRRNIAHANARESALSWTLRYVAHLGFRSPDAPLFPASAGSSDPLAQMDFAASIGFAGIQDPWFAARPPATQAAIAARLRERGLVAGCLVCGAPADVRTPLWTCVDIAGRRGLEAKLDEAVEAARRLGSRQIVALTGFDADSPRQSQIDRFVSNLAWAASRVADEGLTLCLEPTNARTLPGMLLNHFQEGCEITRAVGRPSVRMIYDTAHVQSMDGDLLGNLERAFNLIEIVQIANHPGRTEPEIGEANLATVIEKVHACGYSGLVELEHVWSKGGLEAEQRGLDWLRRIDAALASANCARSRRSYSN